MTVTERLERPLKKIAGPFIGPVSVGAFDDGTLCIAGPNDSPVLIRNGGVMRLTGQQGDDLVFSYFDLNEMLESSR